ncbi:unnamed protein product [Auanema sp. JU1783]|nr:unnamed protein product [Auanema sp. JU1783]
MANVNVTAADQQQINKFARLHQNLTQLKEDLAGIANEIQNINDASDELLLLDSEDTASIPYKIGNTFIHLSEDDLNAKLETVKTELESDSDKKKEKSSGIAEELDQLKKTLYAKFGDRINLETDKDD